MSVLPVELFHLPVVPVPVANILSPIVPAAVEIPVWHYLNHSVGMQCQPVIESGLIEGTFEMTAEKWTELWIRLGSLGGLFVAVLVIGFFIQKYVSQKRSDSPPKYHPELMRH